MRIVDIGSLSRAASVLHVAQSALSQQVAALEAELGSPLLVRTARGVSPTEAGSHLYRHAQALLQQAQDAKAAVAACSSAPTGQVALGLPLTLVAPFAMPLFDAVADLYPGIRLQIHEELSGTILEWVHSGRLTLGVAFDDGALDGLQATPLIEERLYLVVPPRSRLARRKQLRLRELPSLDLMLPSAGQGVRDRVDRALAREGLAPAKIVAEMNSLTMMKQAVMKGRGATILGWPSLEAEVAQGSLAAVEITGPALTRTASICHAGAVPPSRAAQCVIAVAVQLVQGLVRRAPWRGVRALAPG